MFERKRISISPAGVALLVSVGLLAASCWTVYQLAQPQDLSDIAGYAELKGLGDDGHEAQPSHPRNLLATLRRADQTGDSVEVSESELNHYLDLTVLNQQNGLFNLITRVDGIWVRLHDGYAELVIERRIQGLENNHAHQISYFLTPESDEKQFKLSISNGEKWLGTLPVGGRIGPHAVPQGLLKPTMPVLDALAEVFEQELDILAKKSRRFDISQDRILYVGRGTERPQP